MQPMDVCRQRLAAQFLGAERRETAIDVVRALGAVQAQDYAGAKWALAQRANGVTDAALDAALADGTLVRTHVLRPTWHFALREDIRWMLALTGPRISASLASYNRKMELTPAFFRRSHAVMRRSLAGGKQLTRAELRVAMERAGIVVGSAQRLGHIMGQAELDFVLCSGARLGSQFTYALFDERVPASPPRDRDESLLDLALRYFRTRGPATPQDFSWWSGLTVAEARHAIDIAGPSLTTRMVGEKKNWIAADAPPPVPARTVSAHLLPNYDEYFIGFRDRSAIGQRLKSTRSVMGGSALIAHVVAVNGELVGGWKRIQEKSGAALQITLATPLTSAETRRIRQEGIKFAAFLERDVEVRIS